MKLLFLQMFWQLIQLPSIILKVSLARIIKNMAINDALASEHTVINSII